MKSISKSQLVVSKVMALLVSVFGLALVAYTWIFLSPWSPTWMPELIKPSWLGFVTLDWMVAGVCVFFAYFRAIVFPIQDGKWWWGGAASFLNLLTMIAWFAMEKGHFDITLASIAFTAMVVASTVSAVVFADRKIIVPPITTTS